MRPLEPRQAKFVEEYLIDANGKQAALRAGYAASGAKETAARLLTNDNVKEALRKARAARAGRTEVTQDMVVEGLLAEAKFTGKGASPAARVAAWSHLGKHLSMFVDRLKVDPDSAPLVQVYLPANNRE